MHTQPHTCTHTHTHTHAHTHTHRHAHTHTCMQPHIHTQPHTRLKFVTNIMVIILSTGSLYSFILAQMKMKLWFVLKSVLWLLFTSIFNICSLYSCIYNCFLLKGKANTPINKKTNDILASEWYRSSFENVKVCIVIVMQFSPVRLLNNTLPIYPNTHTHTHAHTHTHTHNQAWNAFQEQIKSWCR